MIACLCCLAELQPIQLAAATSDTLCVFKDPSPYGSDIACGLYQLASFPPSLVDVSGVLSSMGMHGTGVCGTNGFHGIYCNTDLLGGASWEQVPGELAQLAVSGDNMCGVNSYQQVFCSSTPWGPGSWSGMEWAYKQVPEGCNLLALALSGTRACGILDDARI